MTPLLSALGLAKSYHRHSLLRSHPPRQVLSDINLDVEIGESLAILGRSGSGKSTLIRQLLGLERPSAGTVRFEGHDLLHLLPKQMREFRCAVQMVFQDSVGAVNPRHQVGRIIAEPLRHLSSLTVAQQQARVAELLSSVGIDPADATKFPGQMSGGQLQRVCIARALATDPRLLVLDEAVSNLDILLQGEIIDLIRQLRKKTGMAVIFITHDLRLVRLLCERVVVLKAGQIVEMCPVDHRLDLTSAEGRALQEAVLPAMPDTPGRELHPASRTMER